MSRSSYPHFLLGCWCALFHAHSTVLVLVGNFAEDICARNRNGLFLSVDSHLHLLLELPHELIGHQHLVSVARVVDVLVLLGSLLFLTAYFYSAAVAFRSLATLRYDAYRPLSSLSTLEALTPSATSAARHLARAFWNFKVQDALALLHATQARCGHGRAAGRSSEQR